MREALVSLLLQVAGRTLLARDRASGSLQGCLDEFCLERERVVIRSGRRELHGLMVVAHEDAPAILLCHGIGERIEYWYRVQVFLRAAGVSSLVFNYTGFGLSRGRASIRRCEEDAVVAFGELKRQCRGTKVVLGYSMGSAVAAAIAPNIEVDGLVLCEGFPTLKDAAVAAGVPQWLARCAEGVWCTRAGLATLQIPVLVVHSDADRLFPLSMGVELCNACGAGGELRVIHGLDHNEPLFRATAMYWGSVLQWIWKLPALAGQKSGPPDTGVTAALRNGVVLS